MSYGSEAEALNALLSIFAGFWLIILAFFVLNIVAGWKIFEKAGQPGWASIVPFYCVRTIHNFALRRTSRFWEARLFALKKGERK